MTEVIESRSEKDTFALGQKLGGDCRPGDIVLPLYHFDVYRIADPEEMDEIGYEDYFFGEGVCLIEWASLIKELIPEHVICVTIEKELDKGFDYRTITIDRN